MNLASPPKGRNVSGIIPLSGWKNSFDFPWPDYLHPIREGMLALERSVLECAYAGCDSIWIVCNDDVAPLVKHRVGDYVMHPRFFEEKNFVNRKDYHERWIPIYYTPISPRDRNRRDSLGWSILHGAVTSFTVADRMTQWARPSKYFVSFPYGIYCPKVVQNHCDLIRGKQSFFLSHQGETVRENKYLSFTFFPSDWSKFKKNIQHHCTRGNKNLPLKERWSSKDFTLDKIFNLDIIAVDEKIEIENYYSLETWGSLKDFYVSGTKIVRPSRKFMKPYYFKNEHYDDKLQNRTSV